MPTLHLPSRGFSLVELLSAIAVIAILAALLIPLLGKYRVYADTVKCSQNIRQWGLGVQLYVNDNNGILPTMLKNGEPNWQEGVARCIIQNGKTAQRFDLRNTLGCPGDNGDKATWGYGINNYLRPKLRPKTHVVRTIYEIESPERFLLLGEDPAGGVWHLHAWSGASGIDYDRHDGSTNVVFADYHVETFTQDELTHADVILDPEDN